MATLNDFVRNEQLGRDYVVSSWLNDRGDKLQAWMNQGGPNSREGPHATNVDATEQNHGGNSRTDVAKPNADLCDLLASLMALDESVLEAGQVVHDIPPEGREVQRSALKNDHEKGQVESLRALKGAEVSGHDALHMDRKGVGEVWNAKAIAGSACANSK